MTEKIGFGWNFVLDGDNAERVTYIVQTMLYEHLARIDLFTFNDGRDMTEKKFRSKTYFEVSQNYPEIMSAMNDLGTAVRQGGPLDVKTTHLIQMAAGAANNSEGSVHSHARRALDAGATPEEIYHTILLLIPTCGFPRAMAAVSWCGDIIEGESKE